MFFRVLINKNVCDLDVGLRKLIGAEAVEVSLFDF